MKKVLSPPFNFHDFVVFHSTKQVLPHLDRCLVTLNEICFELVKILFWWQFKSRVKFCFVWGQTFFYDPQWVVCNLFYRTYGIFEILSFSFTYTPKFWQVIYSDVSKVLFCSWAFWIHLILHDVDYVVVMSLNPIYIDGWIILQTTLDLVVSLAVSMLSSIHW